jgi:hypothetical protein
MSAIGLRTIGVGCILLTLLSSEARAQEQPALVVVAGPPPTQDYVIRTDGPELTHVFQIEARTATAPGAVAIQVSPLTARDFTVVKPTWTPATTTLQGHGLTLVEVKAVLPAPGEYTGELAVIHGPTRVTRTFHVRVPRPATPGALLAIPAKLETLPWGEPLPTRLRIGLQSVADELVTMRPPALVDLALKGTGDASYQPGIVRATFRKPDGSVFEHDLDLEPRATAELTLELTGIRQPGHYTGTVQVTSTEGHVLSQPLALFVRQSWAVLAVCLLVGVGVSTGLRYWLSKGRPRLIWHERLLLLLRKVGNFENGAAAGEREHGVFLRASIEQALSEVDADWVADMEDRLKRLDQLVALYEEWLDARRRMGESEAAELREVLEEASDALKSTTLSASDIEQVRNQLRKALDNLTRSRAAEAASRRVSPLDQLAALRAALAKPPIVQTRTRQWEALRRQAEELHGELAGAPQPANAGERVRKLLREFLDEVVAETREDLPGREQVAQASDKKDEIEAVLGEVKRHVDAIVDKLSRNSDVEGAASVYNQLVEPYEKLLGLTTGSAMFGARVELGALAIATDERGSPGQTRVAGAWYRARTLEDVRRERKWKEAGATLIGLGVALMVGTQLLWLDDLMWGGPGAWIKAILWGLGLHQVSGVAFDGIEGLIARIAK